MVNQELSSFKELEDVHLKATQQIEMVDGRTFDEGETIALFDRIQISGLEELKDYVAARGGFDNRGLVYWETTRELNLRFSQGVFSKIQFGLLNNANIISYNENQPVLITVVEEAESNSIGQFLTKHEPFDQIFVYKKETGEKIYWHRIGDYLKINESYTDVIVKYRYKYTGGASVAMIGQRCLKGFLEFEGKTRIKDDTSGLITTGIIRIPKLKLMSGLSMKLGAQAGPVVGNFEAVGVPVGERHSSYVAEFYFLNNDIDSDM